MKFKYHDGGRRKAGYRGGANDCVTRAVAIVSGLPYRGVYKVINECIARNDRHRFGRKQSARNGVQCESAWFKRLMFRLGFVHSPVPGKPLVKNFSMPDGKLMVTVEWRGKRGKMKHLAIAVIDGVFFDTGPIKEQARLTALFLKSEHELPPDEETSRDWLHIQLPLMDDDTESMSLEQL